MNKKKIKRIRKNVEGEKKERRRGVKERRKERMDELQLYLALKM